MVNTIIPFVPGAWFDLNGDPADGYQLFTYEAGTTTKQATYNGADPNTASANTNPIILDSSGWASVFLPPGTTYKFVLAPPNDTDPPSNPLWTRDGITATAPYGQTVDVNGRSGETVAVNDCVYLSDGTGGLTSGRWYLTDSDVSYKNSTPDRVGIVTSVAGVGSALIVVRLKGAVENFTSLSVGQTYYIASTPGALAATGYRKVGSVLNVDTTFVVDPDDASPYNTDIQGVASQSIAYGDVVYPSTQVGGVTRWSKARGDLTTLGWTYPVFGFAVTAATSAGDTFTIRTNGIVTGLSGLTANNTLYMDGSTTGAITATAPGVNRIVGIANSSTSLIIAQSPGQRTYGQYTAVGNVGAGEDNLMSFTFNNFLNLDRLGSVCEIVAFGTTAANGNNKQIRLRVDGSLVVASGVIAPNDQDWVLRATIVADPLLNDKAIGSIQFDASANMVGYAALSTVATSVIQVTGEATSNNDIVQQGMTVTFSGF